MYSTFFFFASLRTLFQGIVVFIFHFSSFVVLVSPPLWLLILTPQWRHLSALAAYLGISASLCRSAFQSGLVCISCQNSPGVLDASTFVSIPELHRLRASHRCACKASRQAELALHWGLIPNSSEGVALKRAVVFCLRPE